jgi:hypothetical protein
LDVHIIYGSTFKFINPQNPYNPVHPRPIIFFSQGKKPLNVPADAVLGTGGRRSAVFIRRFSERRYKEPVHKAILLL